MIDLEWLPPGLYQVLKQQFGDQVDRLEIPPPVFKLMQAEIEEFDIENGHLKCRFPILPDYLNPFGSVQGGVIATAIDNTFGPLSMLMAPPNFTRELTVKYRKTVQSGTANIYVTASFAGRDRRRLHLEARAVDDTGDEIATATAVHWIVKQGTW